MKNQYRNGDARHGTRAKKKGYVPNPDLNLSVQKYKEISLQLIDRVYKKGMDEMKAKRYLLIPPDYSPRAQTNQNLWIPCQHLHDDGTIKEGENIDYVFRSKQQIMTYAGYTEPIIGIKRRTVAPSYMED